MAEMPKAMDPTMFSAASQPMEPGRSSTGDRLTAGTGESRSTPAMGIQIRWFWWAMTRAAADGGEVRC